MINCFEVHIKFNWNFISCLKW